MSEHELMPAITLMERKVVEGERKVNELLSALNVLRAEAGLPPRPRGGGVSAGDGAENPVTQIKPDTFFGQKQQSAMRMYLHMRKTNGLGPAKPREIYDALLAGGYRFEAKDIENALVGMRALLRKRTEIFTKLPNGTYGLASWYPNARKPRATAQSDGANNAVDDEEEENEAATTSKGAAAA